MKNISLMDLSQLFEILSQAWEDGDFDRVSDVLDFIRLAVRMLRNDASENHETIFECGLCPNCGSTEIRVDRTIKPIRDMYCYECGKTWGTVTVNLIGPDALQAAADIQKKIDMAESLPYPARLKNSLRV